MAKKKHYIVGGPRLRASRWAIASALAIAAVPLVSEAAGLGKVTVFSALGQPLRAELEVFATREELAGMKAQVASQEAFKQAGVEYAPTLSAVTLTVDKRPNGQSIIRLTSAKPINEPFVDLLLELNWATGRLIREYTFLLDPPEFAAKTAAAAAPAISKPVVAARQSVETFAVEERPSRPSRSRTREPVQKPVDAAGTYEVKRGETLGKIAAELRPEGVSLDQMLLGLFRANQEAFDRGNINRLKAGKILSIPDKSTLEAIPRNEAKTIIVAQSSDWGVYRRKLATVAADVPARDEGARQQVAGKISTKVEDKAGPAAEPKDQLKVSKTDLPGAKPLPASKRSDEDLIAKEKALKDANDRLASLERNVAELQRLLELKSQNLAELERQSAGKPAPAVDTRKAPDVAATVPIAPTAPTAPAPVPSPVPARVDAAPTTAPAASVKPLEPPAESRPAETLARSEPEPRPKLEEPKPEVKVEAPPPSDAPKPVEARKTRAAPPPPPEEPGFIEELLGSTSFLAAGGGIVALLAAYWFARRRRQSDGELPLDDNSTLAPLDDSLVAKSVFRSTGGQSVDTTNSMPQTDFSQAGPGSIDTDEVDPVAEADVYMAYGRDAQAEEILLEAKHKDPGRHAIHLKLLEIYSVRKDLKPFGLLAAELFNATGGVGADWEKAVLLGLQLDPGNPLFASAGQTDLVLAGGPDTTSDAAPEPLVDTFTNPAQVLQMATAAGMASEPSETGAASKARAEEKPAPAALEDLDFDLGISEPGPASPAGTKNAYLETTLAFPKPAAGDALDFDLAASLPDALLFADIGENEVQMVEDASALEVTMLVAPGSQPSTVPEDTGLDFEFDLQPEPPAEARWEERTLTQGESEASDAFDLGSAGADAMEFDIALPESTAPAESMPHAAFDLSSISLDLASTDVLSGLDTEVATEVASEGPAFSFDEDQEDTLVNPDFSMEQTDAGLGSSFASLPDMTVGPEISANEEVATKIDLAKAYQEMGDLEGARELLQEVVDEGDAAQRGTALSLLAELRE